ncbi:hypothetical protein GGX14DRAFT_386844 [Mycena pura]|uniref:Uncharacterized protein n=1 Tax=Mycena pura TaxID=153505 RepID=A0AAD6YME7_9AGAR|nr:hypothetical protein GGX14DRAFT_386844 [Mycena pura]
MGRKCGETLVVTGSGRIPCDRSFVFHVTANVIQLLCRRQLLAHGNSQMVRSSYVFQALVLPTRIVTSSPWKSMKSARCWSKGPTAINIIRSRQRGTTLRADDDCRKRKHDLEMIAAPEAQWECERQRTANYPVVDMGAGQSISGVDVRGLVLYRPRVLVDIEEPGPIVERSHEVIGADNGKRGRPCDPCACLQSPSHALYPGVVSLCCTGGRLERGLAEAVSVADVRAPTSSRSSQRVLSAFSGDPICVGATGEPPRVASKSTSLQGMCSVATNAARNVYSHANAAAVRNPHAIREMECCSEANHRQGCERQRRALAFGRQRHWRATPKADIDGAKLGQASADTAVTANAATLSISAILPCAASRRTGRKSWQAEILHVSSRARTASSVWPRHPSSSMCRSSQTKACPYIGGRGTWELSRPRVASCRTALDGGAAARARASA